MVHNSPGHQPMAQINSGGYYGLYQLLERFK